MLEFWKKKKKNKNFIVCSFCIYLNEITENSANIYCSAWNVSYAEFEYFYIFTICKIDGNRKMHKEKSHENGDENQKTNGSHGNGFKVKLMLNLNENAIRHWYDLGDDRIVA